MTPPLNAHLQRLVTTVQSILNDAESERSAGGADTPAPPQPTPAPQTAPPARAGMRGFGKWAILALALVLLAFLGIWQPWKDRSETPADAEPSQAQTQTREVGTSGGASLQAEASVSTGAHVRVEWSGPDGERDFIAISRPGDGPDGYNSYTYTSNGNPLKVRVPDETGEWELRYVSGTPRAILARSPLQVVAAEASVQAAPRATAGAAVRVDWTGPDNERDYIAIARSDAAPGNYENYTYTGQGNPLEIRAPDKPGTYELRYASGHRGAIFARAPLEVIAAEASLQAPESAPAGSRVRVEWQGPDNERDYIAIARPDAAPGNYENYTYTSEGSPLEVKTPDAPGSYELRYASGQHGTIWARRPLLVE